MKIAANIFLHEWNLDIMVLYYNCIFITSELEKGKMNPTQGHTAPW